MIAQTLNLNQQQNPHFTKFHDRNLEIVRSNDNTKKLSHKACYLMEKINQLMSNNLQVVLNHQQITKLTGCTQSQNNRLLLQLNDIFNFTRKRYIKVNNFHRKNIILITRKTQIETGFDKCLPTQKCAGLSIIDNNKILKSLESNVNESLRICEDSAHIQTLKQKEEKSFKKEKEKSFFLSQVNDFSDATVKLINDKANTKLAMDELKALLEIVKLRKRQANTDRLYFNRLCFVNDFAKVVFLEERAKKQRKVREMKQKEESDKMQSSSFNAGSMFNFSLNFNVDKKVTQNKNQLCYITIIDYPHTLLQPKLPLFCHLR